MQYKSQKEIEQKAAIQLQKNITALREKFEWIQYLLRCAFYLVVETKKKHGEMVIKSFEEFIKDFSAPKPSEIGAFIKDYQRDEQYTDLRLDAVDVAFSAYKMALN
jgi:hypothetical protein